MLVGLLLAQLEITLRLRRLSAAAEALALGGFEGPLRYRFRRRVRRARAELRPHAPAAATLLPARRGRARPPACVCCSSACAEGIMTIDEDLLVHFAKRRGAPPAGRAARRRRARCRSRGPASPCASSSSASSRTGASRCRCTSPRTRSMPTPSIEHPGAARPRLGAHRHRRPDPRQEQAGLAEESSYRTPRTSSVRR